MFGLRHDDLGFNEYSDYPISSNNVTVKKGETNEFYANSEANKIIQYSLSIQLILNNGESDL